MVVQKAEYNKSGRNSAVVKMKFKNLLTGAGMESVYKADDKFDVVVLERKEVTYSYFADPMYVFMDADYNQYEVEGEMMGDAMNYLEDGMTCEVVFYNEKADLGRTADHAGSRNHLYGTGCEGRHVLGQGAEECQARTPVSNCKCRCSATSATRSKSTRVRTSIEPRITACKRPRPARRNAHWKKMKSAPLGAFSFLCRRVLWRKTLPEFCQNCRSQHFDVAVCGNVSP